MKKLFVLIAASLILTGCVVYPGYDYGYNYPDYGSYPYGYVGPNVNLSFSNFHGGHSHGGGHGFRGGGFGHGGGHGHGGGRR